MKYSTIVKMTPHTIVPVSESSGFFKRLSSKTSPAVSRLCPATLS
jgi:hypothetical protein